MCMCVYKLNFWVTRFKNLLNVFINIILYKRKRKGERAKKNKKFSESGGY